MPIGLALRAWHAFSAICYLVWESPDFLSFILSINPLLYGPMPILIVISLLSQCSPLLLLTPSLLPFYSLSTLSASSLHSLKRLYSLSRIETTIPSPKFGVYIYLSLYQYLLRITSKAAIWSQGFPIFKQAGLKDPIASHPRFAKQALAALHPRHAFFDADWK